MQWTLVVPLKPLPQAKSRLADTADDGLRPGLALAFAQDTVAAALACPAVRDVVVVTNDALAARELAALGAGTVPDLPRAGLNAALTHAATVVGAARRAASVAALNADLAGAAPFRTGPGAGRGGGIPAVLSRGFRGNRHDPSRREPRP